MNDSLVSLKDVTIRYPDQSTFHHINLDIKRGEHLALTGENEPLKSALLDALGGQVSIINGKKVFHVQKEFSGQNASLHSTASPQKFIASVSSRHQFRNLSHTNDFYYQQRFNSSDSENSLTVQEYLSTIQTFGSRHSWTFENTIERLNLYRLLSEGLIKLSNGETKRVLIAAALLQNPLLLILHNPLTGLDVQARQDIENLINQIAETGITIVMSVPSKEIPGAVTHIAVVDNANAITIIPKDDYRPAESVLAIDSQVDEGELKTLLFAKSMPVFDTIVKMSNVCIHYDDRVILDKINWTIKQGERWALVGPNGSGKSTLLSLINGDNPQAFANNIILFDRKKGSGESIWDIKRKVGFFSPELYQYFPGDTSCLQAVESGFYDTIGLFRPSHPESMRIALRWMKVLGVDKYAEKLLRNVSPINQRLVLLARALVKSPLLLILDEPCQGFDEVQIENFKRLLNTICALSNVTLIYVSHYQDEMPECITKVFRLKEGKQVEIAE
jgi:molybdate transport system ATP-binding protein